MRRNFCNSHIFEELEFWSTYFVVHFVIFLRTSLTTSHAAVSRYYILILNISRCLYSLSFSKVRKYVFFVDWGCNFIRRHAFSTCFLRIIYVRFTWICLSVWTLIFRDCSVKHTLWTINPIHSDSLRLRCFPIYRCHSQLFCLPYSPS